MVLHFFDPDFTSFPYRRAFAGLEGMDVVVSIEVSAEMVMVVKVSLDLNSESVYGSRPGTTIELDWKIMIRAPHYYVRAYK